MVAAVAVLALAAGMTSLGGAPFVAKLRQQLIGEREMVKVNSEREGEDDRLSTEREESKAWQEIEDKLGIEPVKFCFIPEGMQLLDYEINEELEEGWLIELFYEARGDNGNKIIVTLYKEEDNAEGDV